MAFKEYTFDDILCAMQNQGKEYDVELIKRRMTLARRRTKVSLENQAKVIFPIRLQ